MTMMTMMLSRIVRSTRLTTPRPSIRASNRFFASQTLLSRTDFDKRTVNELKEELRRRGLTTGSKKKSALIKAILEDERRRASAVLSPGGGFREITTAKKSDPPPAAEPAAVASASSPSPAPALKPTAVKATAGKPAAADPTPQKPAAVEPAPSEKPAIGPFSAKATPFRVAPEKAAAVVMDPSPVPAIRPAALKPADVEPAVVKSAAADPALEKLAKSPVPAVGPAAVEPTNVKTTAVDPAPAKPAAVEPSASPAPVISSPAHVVARVLDEADADVPVAAKVETGSSSAALASPVTNMKSEGHRAETWPATVILPKTPEEEHEGTAIPFIPDNYASHEQSHAPALTDVKASSAGLEISTASHPSTLPEGGPSLAAVDRHLSSPEDRPTAPLDFENLSSQIQGLWSGSSDLKSLVVPDKEPFKPEDRPLTQDERRGIYHLIGLLSASWILAGLLK